MKVKTIASRYRVLRELGRGGMGVVYVVEHLHTGERLALKLLHGTAAANPEVIARFKREARAAAQIKSEHVVRVTDADVAPELGGAPFFVMELLEGFDLEKAVEKRDRLHPDAVVAILSQVARALDKAHAIGIVHRDLKPENIFLHRRDGAPPIAKVLDFGISKFGSREGANRIGTTADGTLMGTPAYMAPEQARGMVDAMGPPTDIWAIGLIALRLLTAESYWTADSQGELMVQILVAPMSVPSERWPWLGRAFDAWFARSCHRDPLGRWPSVSQQVEALATALADVAAPSEGASMDVLAEALRDRPTGHGTVPSSEAALPEVSSQIAEESVRQRLPAATTGGAESVTVKPFVRRRRSIVWVLLGGTAVATVALAVFAPRLLRAPPAPLTESASSGPPTRIVAHVAVPLSQSVDAGGDTPSSAPSAISVELARPVASRTPQTPAAAPRQKHGPQGPQLPAPRSTHHEDPMAP